MAAPIVKVRVDGHSGTIVLNRPESRNSRRRGRCWRKSSKHFRTCIRSERFARSSCTGNGPCFCAGLDLREMHETAQTDGPEMQWHEDALHYRELIQAMLQYPKPIIASVNGATFAGGTGLVLAADIVIAAESSRFAVSAPRRGLVAGMVAPLLEFRIGGGHAALLLLTSREIDSQTAFRMGIFTRGRGGRSGLGPSPRGRPRMCGRSARGHRTDQAHAERDDRRAPDDHAGDRSRRDRHGEDDRSRVGGHPGLRRKTRTTLAVAVYSSTGREPSPKVARRCKRVGGGEGRATRWRVVLRTPYQLVEHEVQASGRR